MEPDGYKKRARIALVAIVLLASLAVASLLVAFSYYCYIRNKVSRRLKNQKSELFEQFLKGFSSFSSWLLVFPLVRPSIKT